MYSAKTNDGVFVVPKSAVKLGPGEARKWWGQGVYPFDLWGEFIALLVVAAAATVTKLLYLGQ